MREGKAMNFFLWSFFFFISSSSSSPSSQFPNAFERMFPENLTNGFDSCKSFQNPGERGVCELLAATQSQISQFTAAATEENDPENDKLQQQMHSCSYKRTNGASFHRYATEASPHLLQLVNKYKEMHRRCIKAEYNSLKQIYEKKLQPRCRYIIWSCSYGLGNRLMSLISTFLYALLSQRVLLIDQAPYWDKLFCSPFEGSQWLMPLDLSLKNAYSSPSFTQFSKLCNNKAKRSRDGRCQTKVVSVVLDGITQANEHKFLVCPKASSLIRNIPILHFRNSNQYYALGFFLNPSLRPVLETLFPGRRVFHDLSRLLVAPSDPVWQRVTKIIEDSSIANSSARIGVQMREAKGEYRDYYDRSVPKCIRRHSNLCPIEIEEYTQHPQKEDSSFISVYVASLAGGHVVKLNKSLDVIRTETGQVYKMTCQESDGEQMDDVRHLQKALVDIWMLSLSDVLLTSPMSTFGYTAQGLSGVTPYHLKPWRNDPCLLTVSSDPCFHFAPTKKVVCKEDSNSSRPAYVRICPDLPNSGLQLTEA